MKTKLLDAKGGDVSLTSDEARFTEERGAYDNHCGVRRSACPYSAPSRRVAWLRGWAENRRLRRNRLARARYWKRKKEREREAV